MKAILQYCLTVDGTYKNIGTVRLKKKDYTVKPQLISNREGEPETAGYIVKARCVCLELNTDFLDYQEWFFRLGFFDPTEMDMILLGQHPYKIDFNGLITMNNRVYHSVDIEFTIEYDEYEDYAVPVTLPASEGGIIVQDDDIYIE